MLGGFFKSSRKYKNYLLFIGFIILIGLVLRLLLINQFAFYDENVWITAGKEKLFYNYYNTDTVYNQPPLMVWIHIFSTSLFGWSTEISRLVILFFWLVNTFILLKILKLQKRAKLFTILVMIFYISSVYGIFASIQLDIDGQLLLFFYLASILSFLKYEQTRKMGYLTLTGVLIGIGFVAKLTAVLMIPILFLYRGSNVLQDNFAKIKKWKFNSFYKLVPEFGIICTISLLIFAAYVVSYIYLGDQVVLRILTHGTDNIFATTFNISHYVTSTFNALVWIPPLFFASTILGIPRFIKNKKDRLFFIWIILLFVFYFYIAKLEARPLEKYFTVLVPAWSVLTSVLAIKYLSPLVKKIDLKRVIFYLFAAAMVFLLILVVLNYSTNTYLPFHPKSAYVEHVAGLDWDFFFPVSGNSGPLGFYLSFLSFSATALMSAIIFLFLLISLILRKKMLTACFFILLISLSFAYSAYMYSEFAFGTLNQNINRAYWDTADYLEQNPQIEPVYVFRNIAFPHYLPSYEEVIWFDFDKEYNITFAEILAETDATVVVVNFPLLSSESPLMKNLERCEKIKSFYDKGQELSTIYRCGATNV